MKTKINFVNSLQQKPLKPSLTGTSHTQIKGESGEK